MFGEWTAVEVAIVVQGQHVCGQGNAKGNTMTERTVVAGKDKVTSTTCSRINAAPSRLRCPSFGFS